MSDRPPDVLDNAHFRHIFWQAKVKHEKRDTYNYHQNNKRCLDPQAKAQDLANFQNLRMKYDFYSKHMEKYMPKIKVETNDPDSWR